MGRIFLGSGVYSTYLKNGHRLGGNGTGLHKEMEVRSAGIRRKVQGKDFDLHSCVDIKRRRRIRLDDAKCERWKKLRHIISSWGYTSSPTLLLLTNSLGLFYNHSFRESFLLFYITFRKEGNTHSFSISLPFSHFGRAWLWLLLFPISFPLECIYFIFLYHFFWISTYFIYIISYLNIFACWPPYLSESAYYVSISLPSLLTTYTIGVAACR